MNDSSTNDDDSCFYRGGREPRSTYIENGLCFGFEAHEGACERELDPGQTLCTRCRELARAYREDAAEMHRREQRRRAGIFTDEEKEIIREELTPAECFEFDQRCAASEYMQGLRTCLRSQSNFALAELREDPLTPYLAAAVKFWRDGRFQTVNEVIDECANHQWNRCVYELWVLETARRVRHVIHQLNGLAASALTMYAKHIDYYDPDPYEGSYENNGSQDEV